MFDSFIKLVACFIEVVNTLFQNLRRNKIFFLATFKTMSVQLYYMDMIEIVTHLWTPSSSQIVYLLLVLWTGIRIEIIPDSLTNYSQLTPFDTVKNSSRMWEAGNQSSWLIRWITQTREKSVPFSVMIQKLYQWIPLFYDIYQLSSELLNPDLIIFRTP